MKHSSSSGFNLTELLVALAVLALIAAIIIPRYLNLQSQAQDSVAQQMGSEINNVYAEWKSSGGVTTGTPNASLLLYILSGQGDPVPANGYNYNSCTVADSGTSSNIRLSLPSGTSNNIDPSSPSNGVSSGGSNPVLIVYSSGSDSFAALPATSFSWQSIGSDSVNAPLQISGSNPNLTYSLLPYAYSYNGISFGNLNKSPVSGSLYGYDGTFYYRADFTQTYIDSHITMLNNDAKYYAGPQTAPGYTPYKYIGRAVIGAMWNITIYKGTKIH